MNPPPELRFILATDCGSTTTKAILIERGEGGWRLRSRGEAPTTVEAPFDDVTVGVRNAFREIEEILDRRILDDDGRVLKRRFDGDPEGVDLYLSTSSAGGGLQMVVAGVVGTMTVESAARAALGAGAIVMDSLASNDRSPPHQRIERIRQLRPDMILLAGGVDGGTTRHVAEMAQIIAAADPRPRLGESYDLPVVYAGNREARAAVAGILEDKVALRIVENVRPVLEREHLGPAREAIHELFMEHVMAQAPGYRELVELADHAIVPTPGAVGDLIQVVAEREGIRVLGVDIGGATTDVFSVFDDRFHRTVSANLGMSYSCSNVLHSAGIERVVRWIPAAVDPDEIRNQIENKTIRPTTIPVELEDLLLEQALAREALRLAFEQHCRFATGLKGVRRERSMGEVFDGAGNQDSTVDVRRLDLLIGSGGVLSHAPRRAQAAWMLLDAFQPEGVTRLAVDSIFMMPQLGVTARVAPEAARQVFERDCLIPLGTVIAAAGRMRPDRAVASVEVELPGGLERFELQPGELRRIPLAAGQRARLRVRPDRRIAVGAGPGRLLDAEVEGGEVGLLFDTRGRPLVLPQDPATRIRSLRSWGEALDAWPELRS